MDIAAAVKAADHADVILLCIGENSYTETPGNIDDLMLSPNQCALAKAMEATGKPVILILNEGRPRIIRDIEPGATGIIDLFLPGNFGGGALAAILSGDENPSGKMPVTYPKSPNSLISYIHKPSEKDFDPQYQFGYGLSYAQFTYAGLSLNKTIFHPAETIYAAVEVKNTGDREGREVVALYSSQDYAAISPDVKRLRRFKKITLKPGETRTVVFDLPLSELAYVGGANKKELEKGTYSLSAGGATVKFTIR